MNYISSIQSPQPNTPVLDIFQLFSTLLRKKCVVHLSTRSKTKSQDSNKVTVYSYPGGGGGGVISLTLCPIFIE